MSQPKPKRHYEIWKLVGRRWEAWDDRFASKKSALRCLDSAYTDWDCFAVVEITVKFIKRGKTKPPRGA